MMDAILYKAAMQGDVEVLRQNADQLQVQRTPNNNTILHVAAQFGQTRCVTEILNKCSLSLLLLSNIKGDTSLHISAREGHIDTVQALIAYAKTLVEDLESGIRGAKLMLRVRNVDGDTALYGAVRSNNLDVVDILTKEDPEFVHPPNNAKETPLFVAVDRNYPLIMSKILKNCTSPNCSGANGRTALHAATICYNKECIEILCRWSPSLTKKEDVYGWRPLHYAAWFGDVSAVRQLLDLDKSVAYLVAEEDGNKTALHIAASQGNLDIVKVLLSYCPDCWEMINSKNQNILHMAVEYDKNEIIEFILENSFLSSLINQNDIDGNTPVHLHAAKPIKRKYAPLVDHNHHTVDEVAFNKKKFTPFDILPGDKNSTSKVAEVDCRNKLKSRSEGTISPGNSSNNRTEGTIGLGNPSNNQSEETTGPGDPSNNPCEGAISPGNSSNNRTEGTIGRGDPSNNGSNNQSERSIGPGDPSNNPSEGAVGPRDPTIKDRENSLVVATLIVAVTFAAGFTLPGGYDDKDGPNRGMALFKARAAFQTFVLSDTLALVLSINAACIILYASTYQDESKRVQFYYSLARLLIVYALGAMMIAFMSGLYVVLEHSSGLGIAVCVICSMAYVTACKWLVDSILEYIEHATNFRRARLQFNRQIIRAPSRPASHRI